MASLSGLDWSKHVTDSGCCFARGNRKRTCESPCARITCDERMNCGCPRCALRFGSSARTAEDPQRTRGEMLTLPVAGISTAYRNLALFPASWVGCNGRNDYTGLFATRIEWRWTHDHGARELQAPRAGPRRRGGSGRVPARSGLVDIYEGSDGCVQPGVGIASSVIHRRRHRPSRLRYLRQLPGDRPDLGACRGTSC